MRKVLIVWDEFSNGTTFLLFNVQPSEYEKLLSWNGKYINGGTLLENVETEMTKFFYNEEAPYFKHENNEVSVEELPKLNLLELSAILTMGFIP